MCTQVSSIIFFWINCWSSVAASVRVLPTIVQSPLSFQKKKFTKRLISGLFFAPAGSLGVLNWVVLSKPRVIVKKGGRKS